MKRIQCGVACMFLAAIGSTIVVFIVCEFTPATSRGDFYYKTGLHLPQGAEIVSTADTTHESFLGDGHTIIVALVNEAAARELSAFSPPWSDEWTIADWSTDQLAWFRAYVNPDTTGIGTNCLLFDIRKSDGDTSHEIMLVSIDDGRVCYCRVSQ